MNKPKIVLAEDNSTLSLLLKFRLEKEGYELLMAVDGNEALELIESHNPDLILTDIMMPFVSGLEVLVMCATSCQWIYPLSSFHQLVKKKWCLRPLI